MTSKDSKYVINSILSAIDLESMEEEDKDEIVDKIEGNEEEGMGDFNPDDMGDEEPDFGGDEMGDEEPVAPEGEMGEGYDDFEDDGFNFDDDDFDDDDEDEYEDDYDGLGIPKNMPPYKTKWHSSKDEYNDHDVDMKLAGDMIEGLFTESKVDSILKGYFKVEENEKRLFESKKRQTKLISENKKTKINKIKQLSESISQEVGARKLMEKYPNAKLVGKTNRQNLVFEMNDEQLRVNTKGQIV